jgi:hypothetical protein
LSDETRKVKPGDPLEISADSWNAAMDAARAHRDSQRDARAHPGTDTRQTGIILVRNSSGADADRLGVLAMTAPLVLPADNEPEALARVALDGDAPAADTDPFCVLLEPLADGAIGRAAVAGVAWALVDFSDAGHGFAAPEAGETGALASAGSGPARVVWKESGTGVKKALVLLGAGASASARKFLRGVLKTTLTFGGSAVIDVRAWNGSAQADTGEDLTVYDDFLSSGQTAAAGAIIGACRDDNDQRWYAIVERCA